MDPIDFDVDEKNKMAPEFKMAGENCFWSSVVKLGFFGLQAK
jgi:hypothetical protein